VSEPGKREGQRKGEKVAERKEASYKHLVHRVKQADYNTHLVTTEVGSRGLPHMAGFGRLEKLGLTQTELSSLLSHTSHQAIKESFGIW